MIQPDIFGAKHVPGSTDCLQMKAGRLVANMTVNYPALYTCHLRAENTFPVSYISQQQQLSFHEKNAENACEAE